MKINSERPIFQKALYVLICAFILLTNNSCQSELVDDMPTKIVGTWHQVSQTKAGAEVVKDSTRLLLQITSTNICVLCDSSSVAIKANKIVKRSGWNYTAGLLNIAVDLPASWKPEVTGNSLILNRVDFDSAGNLYTTTQKFDKVADIEFK